MNETLRAFTDCTLDKQAAVALAVSHAEQDRLISGAYYRNGTENWKGCSVGCFTHDNDGGHEMYPEMLGLPAWVAHLQDRIFEGLNSEDRAWWHVGLFEAIKPGADMAWVFPRIIHWTLTDGLPTTYREEYPDCAKAVDGMAALWARVAAGETVSDAEFDDASAEAARSAWAARSAEAAEAAWAARSAEAAEAAWAAEAVWSAEAAEAAWAAEAARSARSAEAAEAARSARSAKAAFYKQLALNLLELCAECPITEAI